MISTSDAIEVMGIVAACHHRTAPRMGDPEATLITAGVWTELFNVHDFSRSELVAAVKKRAADGAVDAPEPAEIITVARATRRALDAKSGPTPEYEARCESKAVDAAELEANRRARALSPPVERPEFKRLIESIAGRKGLPR